MPYFFLLGGLLVSGAFVAAGRWVNSHPAKFLDKLYPGSQVHGKFSLGNVRFIGAFFTFAGICGLYGVLAAPLGRFVSNRVHAVSILLAATITAWYLLRREPANGMR